MLRTSIYHPVFVSLCFLSALGACALPLREREAVPGTWGYRPVDGGHVAINPPAFTWAPERGDARYDLEIATGSDFETVVYRVVATRWSAHCPDAILEPGTYHWRYRTRASRGRISDWSMVRSFVIAEDAMAYPKPSRAQQASLVPDSHPRLFLRPEGIEALRSEGASAGAESTLAAAYARVVAEADGVLENPPDTTEPPLYPDDVVRKSGEWKAIWWGNRRRALAAGGGAEKLAFAYLVTGDPKYADAAKTVLLAITEWDPDGSTNWRYNDEAAMPMVYMPARTYTWIYDRLSEDERRHVRAMLAARAEDCFEHLRGRQHLWKPYESHNNRAWHWLGEVALALYGDVPEAADWLDYALTIYFTCYPVWGGDDGGWHEGVGYWVSYLQRFQFWVLAMRSALAIDAYQKPFFSETGYYGMYTLPPHAPRGPWGDGAGTSGATRIAPFMGMLGAAAQNPHWAWYAEQHAPTVSPGWFALLFQRQAQGIAIEPPVDLPPSRAFEGIGVAVINTNLLDARDNIQVHFKSSPTGRQSHGYNANNAFQLYVDGIPMLLASGRRDVHGSPHHTQWMWSDRSDNAILVGGQGQKPHAPDATGRITAFESGEGWATVQGDASAAFEGRAQWIRTLRFEQPGYLVVVDEIETPEPQPIDWLLHANGPFAITDQGASLTVEDHALDIRWLEPQNLAITQTNAFDPPPADWATFTLDQWHLTARTSAPAAQHRFVTLIGIDQTLDDVTVDIGADGAGSIRIRHIAK